MSSRTTREAQGEVVIVRFETVGRAIVELRAIRFETKWGMGGPPISAIAPYEIDGFNWWCLGCGAFGREGDTYNDPGFRQVVEARKDAQAHSERCRAMPTDLDEPRLRMPRWIADLAARTG